MIIIVEKKHNEILNYLNNLSNMAVMFKAEQCEENQFDDDKKFFVNEVLQSEIDRYKNTHGANVNLSELFYKIFQRAASKLQMNQVFKDYLILDEKIYEVFLCNAKHGFVSCNIYEIAEALDGCEDLGFYKNVVANAMDIIFFVNEDGKILYGNKKAVDSYGYTFEELIKMSIFELRNGEKREHAKGQLRQALEHGIKFETYHYKKNGHKFSVEVNSIHISENSKNVVMSVIRDISERERVNKDAEMFSTTLNIFEEAVIVVNKNDVITHWSKGAENRLGFCSKEVIGQRFDLLLPEGKEKENDELYNRVYKGEIIENFETARRHKNSNNIEVSVSISSIRDQDGEYNGFIAVYTDISEKKKLLNQLREYEVRCRNALDGGQFGLWDINVVTNEAYFSRRWKEIIGYNEEELENIKSEWKDRIHPEDLNIDNSFFMNDTSNREKITEYRIRCKNGSYKWIRVKGRVVEWTENQEVLRIIGTIEDIDNRKYFEQSLKEKNKQLEILKEEADSANKAKSLFLANISHEIRTPLHGVLGTLQLLETTKLNEQQNKYLASLKESASNLIELINDLLDISKIESGSFKLNYRAFNIEKTIKNVFQNLVAAGNAKGLEIGIYMDNTITPEVIGDELRLKQILTNLLDNAIKYTDNGAISFHIRRLASEENYQEIEFRIKDSGIGIDESMRDKIFNDFVQGDLSAGKKYMGSGLGLSICKRLTELMNGDLRFESQVDVGTTFYFTCKFKNYLEPSQPVEFFKDKAATSYNSKNKNVLCVEDNIISLDIIEGLIKTRGYNCFCARNGEKALEIVKSTSIDLILLDLQMPVMNGIEITKIIRSRETGDKHIPIVALTAYAQNGDRDMCLEAGMDDYISKPFDKENLYKVIEKHI